MLTNSSDDSVSERDHDEVTSDVVETFLLVASKGLAEMTKGSHLTVQFVHESVRDYLLDKSFALFQPRLSENILSISHECLRDRCLHYFEKSQAAYIETHMLGQ